MSIKDFFKFLFRQWMKLAHFIGRINTLILLTIFYSLFIGFSKLVVVLLRKDPLDMNLKDRSSYWRKRQDFKTDRQSFLKPY